MKKKILIIVQCFMCSILLHAQDAYHVKLLDILKTDYKITASSQWATSDNEVTTINNSISYGGNTKKNTVIGQPFTQAVERTVNYNVSAENAKDTYTNQDSISVKDVCLAAVWLRSSENGAQINMYGKNKTISAKYYEFYRNLTLTKEWKLFLIPFYAKITAQAGDFITVFALATSNQTVEIGGFAMLNFKNKVNLDLLPIAIGSDYYIGIEDDAPWRVAAANRIENLRKANLTVKVQDMNGKGINGAKVHVEMLQHEYKFGTVLTSQLFNGVGPQFITYEQKMLNLDGKGHGFNEAAFTNELRWGNWEDNTISQKRVADDIKWLRNKDISVRGTNLVTPNVHSAPDDFKIIQSVDSFKNRIFNHIEEVLQYPNIGAECEDWDVIQDIIYDGYSKKLKSTTGYVTGLEIFSEIYDKSKILVTNAHLYLSDYAIFDPEDKLNKNYDKWKTYIAYLKTNKAPLEGLSFPTNFSKGMTSLNKIIDQYDEIWNLYNLPSKVTDYDLTAEAPQKTQAQYLHDFLTISFAHPSSKGFIVNNFWDGAHWLGKSPLFAKDWTIKPSGQAYIDLVFKDWWIDVNLISATNGDAKIRAFKGKYKVTVTLPNNTTQTLIFDLSEDKTLIVNNLGITISDKNVSEKLICNLYPNPVHDIATLSINTTENSEATISIIDLKGQVLQTQHTDLKADKNNILLNTEALTNGLYFVKISTNTGVKMLKMEVVR